MCYNNYMKKNNLLKINVFAIVFFLLFGIGFYFLGAPKTDMVVYAQETEDLQIENDGMFISSELWVALYNAYQNIFGEKPVGDVLTVDMFKNSNISILNLSTNLQGQSYGIRSISGLGEFDLSAFTNINLSGNYLNSVGEELNNLQNLTKLDLSDNNLGNFSTDMLHSNCLNSLEILDLSNNSIANCDLTGLQKAEVDLSYNYLKDGSLTLPQAEISINLNNNLILEPNTELVNVAYGYQGAKNNQKIEKTTDILFLAHDKLNFTSIEIYENDNLVDTLTNGEKITLPVGNYKLKFLNISGIEVQEEISFKVILPKLTAKLFVNDKEIEFSSVITEDTVIKFYGEDGAEIFISTNRSSEILNSSEYEINGKNGSIVITAYQTKDGYSSNATSFYFTIKKSNIGSWVIIGVGVVGFVLLYFAFNFVVKKIMNKTDKTKTKGQLD